MQNEYAIEHITEGSICLGDRTRHAFTGTYQEAVDAAHRVFAALKVKTNVALYRANDCLYFWHYIRADGTVEDRNTNSGATW